MATQTSFTAAPAVAYPGQLADSGTEPDDILSTIVDASALVAPGLLALRTTGGDYCADVPGAVASDDDSIMTATATSASQQILGTGGTAFDGVIADGRISPPRKVTITRSSHANQDAVTAVLAGLDENGVPVTENFSFADGGGDSFTSTYYYSRVTSLTIPAQAGTGGTTKIGTGTAAQSTLDGGDVLGLTVLTHKTLISPSSSNNEKYEDTDQMPVLRKGRIWLACETSFRAGDVPMFRLVAGVGEQLGAMRAHDSDSGDAVPCRRMRILNSGTSSDLALVEVNL